MNIEELYHFLFETMPGIGILVGGGPVSYTHLTLPTN